MPTTKAPITPAQVHQSWLQILFQIIQIGAAVAPIVAAPLVSSATETEIATESQVAEQVATVLAASQAAK